jgi:hypothetical protein
VRARRLMAARCVALVAGLVIVSLSLVACGGGGKQSAGDAYAKRLSSSCSSMRKQVEALGKPGDTPIAKVYPGTVKIGRAFLREIAKLDPPAAGKANAKAMAREYAFYFDGLALAYALLTKRKSQQGFVQTAQAAVANLNLAIGFAKQLGAAECAHQPFD